MIPLFEKYPKLKSKIPHVSLGGVQTPAYKAEKLGRELGINLYLKRDGEYGSVYGGNKVRKLEFLLAEALNKNAKEVLTFGCSGSDHALATTVSANQVGLKSISILLPQPNAHYVRQNLLLGHLYKAEMHHYRNKISAIFGAMVQILKHRYKSGISPYIIPAGGSSPLSTLGYVNAAFELKKQIDNQEIPEPDYIYIAFGSTGTAVGLTLGLRSLNCKSIVVPIRIAEPYFANRKNALKILARTNSLLTSSDPAFPKIQISNNDFNIRHDFYGKQYALFTKAGMNAISLLERYEGIKLDPTNTAKAFAALIDDAKRNKLDNKVVLFWNTHNSIDMSERIDSSDYKTLPNAFHQYFTSNVQPLDFKP